MDRIHRIGQKRPVRVYRLLMKDSIEERMVDLQDAKTMLGRCTQEKMDRENMRKARMTFLRDLFQVESLDEDWKDK
jgi:SNF2 family DNA or RNA helicase